MAGRLAASVVEDPPAASVAGDRWEAAVGQADLGAEGTSAEVAVEVVTSAAEEAAIAAAVVTAATDNLKSQVHISSHNTRFRSEESLMALIFV